MPTEPTDPTQPHPILPEPAAVVRCHPDPARMGPFRDLVAVIPPSLTDPYFGVVEKPDPEWGMGNVSTRAITYSCGHLTRDDTPLDHRHDPAELTLCECITNEAVSRLSRFRVGESEPIGPFFAAAVMGAPAPEVIDESLVRSAFGGTLAPGLLFQFNRLERRDGYWNQMDGLFVVIDLVPPEVLDGGDLHAYFGQEWNAFADWFVNVPGLRGHTVVGIGYSDADPGVLKPRLLLALTAAGSLVGVMSYVPHA